MPLRRDSEGPASQGGVRHTVLDDSATDLERLAIMIGAEIRTAVRAGISEAVADPENWASAVDAIRHQAEKHAGGWLFGGVRMLLSRAMWIALIVLGLYMVGGWHAAMAFFKGGQH